MQQSLHPASLDDMHAAGRTALAAVLAPAAAWSVDLLASIAIHHDYCAALVGRAFRPWTGVGVLLGAMGITALLVALAAGWVSWQRHIALGSDTGQDETHLDRQRFLARAGLLTCALFSFGILLRLIAPFVVSPDWCGS